MNVSQANHDAFHCKSRTLMVSYFEIWSRIQCIHCVYNVLNFITSFIFTSLHVWIYSKLMHELSTCIWLVYEQWNWLLRGSVRTYKQNSNKKYHLYSYVFVTDLEIFKLRKIPCKSQELACEIKCLMFYL